jgi:hypothetical protein
MPKNQLKRRRGTVVETVYVKKTSSRGEVKIVAKHQARASLAQHSLRSRKKSHSNDGEHIDILEQETYQSSQIRHQGKVW